MAVMLYSCSVPQQIVTVLYNCSLLQQIATMIYSCNVLPVSVNMHFRHLVEVTPVWKKKMSSVITACIRLGPGWGYNLI